MQRLLGTENFRNGFLIDEELMAGVTEQPQGSFAGYVLRHTTGEYLGYARYASLEEALGAINAIPREWRFEQAGGCGGERCGEGKCKGSKCGIFNPSRKAQSAPAPCPEAACEPAPRSPGSE